MRVLATSVSKNGNRVSRDSTEHYLTEERYHQTLFLFSCIHNFFGFFLIYLSLVYILYFYPFVCEQAHLYSESILSHI